MNGNNLGEKLKIRRVTKGLTLNALKELSGVSSSHMGRIERGERNPTAKILRKIAGPLGYTETELLKMADFMSPDEKDDRIVRLKSKIKHEIAEKMSDLISMVDSL